MEAQEFGARLRQLRNQAGMTQRELAERVNIDFSYLSKIESGVVPPPSEKVISQLAEALNADKDELIISAGKVPSDIVQILKNQETLQRLRSARAKQMARSSKKRRGTVDIMKQLVSYKSHKSLSKIAIPIVLVIVVATSLWFAGPVTNTAIAANNQGFAYNNEGEYHKALVAFNKAIELDPNFAPAFNNRGWAYIELKQYEEGIADCTKAIELDPSLALAYNNRGWAYILLGQYEQGIADCTKAIELDPNLAIAYNNRGWAYIELEQYEQAIADYDKAIELDPNLHK